MKNLIFIFFSLLLIACSNDNCTDDVVGTYSGSCTSSLTTFEGEVIITESSEGGSNVFIQDGITEFGVSGYMGVLSPGCNTIAITDQHIVTINGAAVTLNGTFHVDDDRITGDLVTDYGATESVCSFDLTKN